MLTNKVILITWASEGLGKALAKELTPYKPKLALLARNESKLKKLQSELWCESECIVCDITKPKDITKAIQTIEKKRGTIDILINNAGIRYEWPTTTHSAETIQKLFETNTLGTINMSKEVIPLMEKQKSGHIVNIISTSGIDTDPNWWIYCWTKRALTWFTKALQKELQPKGIKVSWIFPGGMDTNIFDASGFGRDGVQPRMMKKEDVAKIIINVISQPKDILIDQIVIRKFM